MANKYNNAYAVLLNNGDSQILPVSKAQLIELAYEYQNGQFGTNAKDVSAALAYLLAKGNTDLDAAKAYTGEQIAGLNSSISVETGYVFGGTITEEAGKLVEGYTSVWLDASVVSYQGGDGEGDPHTVQAAIENIQSTLSSLAGDGEGSVQTQITNALDDLHLPKVSETGKPITYVSQDNGQVAAGTGNIDAQYVDVDNENNKFHLSGDNPAETISTQSALEQLQSEIDSRDARYELVLADGDKPENVLHRYKLSQTVDNVSSYAGVSIDIPKDQSLISVFLGTSTDSVNQSTGAITYNPAENRDAQSMNFVHQLANGTYSMTHVDVSYFLNEAEFGDGLTVGNNHKVVVNTGNGITITDGAVTADVKAGDPYIEIDSNGKIASKGIDSAISTATEGLNSEIAKRVDTTSHNDYTYVLAGLVETNGKLVPGSTSYEALTDENIKTLPFETTDGMYELLGSNVNTNIKDVHSALNAIASQVNNLSDGAVTDIDTVNSQKSYVTISAEKTDGNTYTLTVDDSKLGNVALLNYDQLAELDENEMITILNANPTV